jgi:hypothetical protein
VAAATSIGSSFGKVGPAFSVGTGAGLRALVLPVSSVAIPMLVGAWMFAPGFRKSINGMFGLNHPAPALDAPPSPPRTYFLPITVDGDRDPTIVEMDNGMVRTMKDAFDFPYQNTDLRLWHPTAPDPNYAHAADFQEVQAAFTAASAATADWTSRLEGTLKQITGQGDLLSVTIQNVLPQVTAMNQLGTEVLPALGAQLASVGTAADGFYQQFREINIQNRREIANTTTGYIPLWNNINPAAMDDSLARGRAWLAEMQTESAKIPNAVSGWKVPEIANASSYLPQNASTPKAEVPAGPAMPDSAFSNLGALDDGTPAAAETGSADGVTPGTPENTKANTATDALLDALKSAASQPIPQIPMPQIPMPQMPAMPQIPSMGGMPSSMPTAAPMPAPADSFLTPKADPAKIDDPLKKLQDEQKKDALANPAVPGTAASTDPAEKKTDPTAAATAATPAALGKTAPMPGQGGNEVPIDKPVVATGLPTDSNTSTIGGKDRTFDSPKLAAMAQSLADANTGEGPRVGKTVEQAASEAGLTVPPPGQDIGAPVNGISDLKPGDVIMSEPDNAVYLGDGDVVTEQGEIKPLSDVTAGMADTDRGGMFRLADDGSPAPNPVISVDNVTGEAGGAVPGVDAPAADKPVIGTDAPEYADSEAGTGGTPGVDATEAGQPITSLSMPAEGDSARQPNLAFGGPVEGAGPGGLTQADTDSGTAAGISQSSQGLDPSTAPTGQ